MKLYWNPFKCYALTCVVVFAVYALNFSDLYPKIDVDVFLFLVLTGGSAALVSWDVSIIDSGISRKSSYQHDLYIFAGIFLGFALEVAYAGVIPLISTLAGNEYDYREFGIPTFHVVLIGVCFFYSMYWWDVYLQGGGKFYFIIAFSGIFWALMIVNRGAVLLSLVAFLFAYGNRLGLRRKLFWIASAICFVVWGFGYMGEIRTRSMGIDIEYIILDIGEANERFKNSAFPNNFFWFYLYASSPLANLQNTANSIGDVDPSLIGIIVDFLPDFISKRLVTDAQLDAIWPILITPQLTVATAFGRPLVTLGWYGPYMLFFYFAGINFLVISYANGSKYFGALLAIACAQGCLMFFDNMMVFSGAVGPIIVGLFLIAIEKNRISIR